MQRLVYKYEPNLSLSYKALSYQVDAIEAIKDLEFAAVFHEQGLGKTKIAIDVFIYWFLIRKVDAVVIVTKKGLVANWKRELAMHTNLNPVIFSQDKLHNHRAFLSTSRLYLTHYEVLKIEEPRFAHFTKFRTVAIILDEAQKIKNPESAVTKALLRLSQNFSPRMILTGTPIANRPFDIWAQIKFLDNGKALGDDFNAFKKHTDLPRGNDVEKFEEKLSELFPSIRGFCVRETKRGERVELPNKEIVVIQCEWEMEQKLIYERIRKEMRIEIMKDGCITEDVSEDVLKRLLRLVQVASNPALIDERYNILPGKFKNLSELVRNIVQAGEKVIIWTTFVKNIDWLSREFVNYSPVKIYGKMNMDSRDRSVRSFINNDDVKVLIATPASAKEGLTLTIANHVIFYDRTFSLDDYSQAQDRIHRISQDKTCYVYNMIMRDSIDEWVDVLMQAKSAAAQLGQGDIDVTEFREYMRYDFGEILNEILTEN